MIDRTAIEHVKTLAAYYPVISISGPRQSGKTTLARMCFPDYKYCTLEDPDIRDLAEQDPRAFLERYDSSVIIDEVQNVPSILSYIQGIVDKRKKKADFILTGSHQPRLAEAVSQSLAGRTGIIRLYPLSKKELPSKSRVHPLQQCVTGFYPAIHADDVPSGLFYSNYFQTYLERDIRQLINIKNSRQFRTFIGLLAGRVGQLVNYNSLAADSGVSNNTIKEWISILEASYIIYTLPPYYKNIRKRLVKSPKIYFSDTGLLCYLLGIKNSQQLERDPLRGSIFENLIIMELIKDSYNRGEEPDFFFIRDSKGFEIDLLSDRREKITLIEIKSSATWNSEFHKNLKTGESLFEKECDLYLVYSGKEEFRSKGVHIISAYGDLKLD